MRTEFKIGDKVECLIFGDGVVTKVVSDGSSDYPVKVAFEGKKDIAYTLDGKYIHSGNRTLTKGSWQVAELAPEPTFELGELVWVKENFDSIWMASYITVPTSNTNIIVVSKDQTKDGKGFIPFAIRKFDEIPF